MIVTQQVYYGFLGLVVPFVVGLLGAATWLAFVLVSALNRKLKRVKPRAKR